MGPDAAPAALLVTLALYRSHVFISNDLLKTLRAMGPAGRAAIPTLRWILKTQHGGFDRFDQVLRTLAIMGQAGQDVVRASIPGAKQEMHLAILKGIQKSGVRAFISDVLRMANHEDVQIRVAALETLRSLDARGDGVRHMLIHTLDEDVYDLRRAACESLAAMGREAKDAIPALTRLLLDRVPVLRLPGRRGTAPYRSVGLRGAGSPHRDADRSERTGPQNNATALGDAGREAIPALRDACRDSSERVRVAAAHSLVRLGVDCRAMLRQIMVDGKTPLARVEAAQALWERDRDPGVVPALVAALRTGRRDPRPWKC